MEADLSTFIQCYQAVTGVPGTEQVHLLTYSIPPLTVKTAGHIYFFRAFFILLLPERKFLNIIPARCRNVGSDVVLVGSVFCALQSKLAPPRQAPELCAVFSTHGAELRSLSC
jgi:hypothetical protein